MAKICTFIGNKDVILNGKDRETLKNLITSAIIDYGATTFYCGNYGNFDLLCATILNCLKKDYDISVIFVTPYLDKSYLNRGQIKLLYDDILYPGLEKVPLKHAIVERNKYMIDRSDIVIAGVYKQFGNAYKFLYYARPKNKVILSLNL